MSIGGGMRFRADGRTPGQLRPTSIELDVQKWTTASVIIRVGGTHVLCAATIEDRIPPHLRGKGIGWVTAEYAMLPGATSERSQSMVTVRSPSRSGVPASSGRSRATWAP